MTLFEKIKDFFVGTSPEKVITGQFVDQPKDYPEGPPKNHTEHIDELGIQSGSKI